MEFKALINERKKQLKSTVTTVTYLDGKCYSETRSSALPVMKETKPCGYVIDNKPDDKPAKIIDNVYLGSQDCCSKDILEKHSITTVLSIGIEAPCKHDGVSYHFMECLDLPETNIWEVIKNSAEVIKSSVKNGENILVHCNAGVSRSPSVIIGYLILNYDIDFTKAFNLVHSARSVIRPNVGFLKQLEQYHLYI